MHLLLSVPETFGERSCVWSTKLHFDEWMTTSLVEQPVIFAYVGTRPVIEVGVLLRVPV